MSAVDAADRVTMRQSSGRHAGAAVAPMNRRSDPVVLSRLDRMIRRLTTQRACLDWALGRIAALPGPILEFGLGIGRSYDHLRKHLPERDIYVFDRVVVARKDCIPPLGRLIVGDFEETVPAAARRFAGQAALVHADVGGHDSAESRALALDLVPYWTRMLRRGGLLLCDQPLGDPALEPLPLPADAPGHYHIARKRDPVAEEARPTLSGGV